ncbi:MAG: erythromycin esterase family protein [Vicinamibacterales bacterium]
MLTHTLLPAFLAVAMLAGQAPGVRTPVQDVASDSRVRWLQEQAVHVRSVDPADRDFRDLKPLKKIIGAARVVTLGEISHGDGTTMLAKSRLVKFLHEEMDFDVLVFEGAFYDMARVWESVEQGNNPVAAVQRGLMPVWSHSPQVADLFAYVGAQATTDHPLALAGFDMQPGSLSRTTLMPELDALVARLGIASEVTTPGTAARALALNLVSGKFSPGGQPAPDDGARDAYFHDLSLLRTRLGAAATSANRREIEFWRQVVSSSLKVYAEGVWWTREHGLDDPDWALFNLRDQQGADNLLWLMERRYRGKKVIVWGATVHVMRQAAAIEATIDPAQPRQAYTAMVPMAQYLAQLLGSDLFAIGFTGSEGVHGVGDPNDKESWHSVIKRDQHPSIELEELLAATGFDYALVDFRTQTRQGRWLTSPIVSRPLGNQAMRAVWPSVFDALFFIRVMEPNLATRPRS